MTTLSNGKFSASLALFAGNSPVASELPSQSHPRSFDVFFDLRLNKRLNAQSRRRLKLKISISIGIPMLTIGRLHDHLIFNMGIRIPGKDGLYIEKGPGPMCIFHGMW